MTKGQGTKSGRGHGTSEVLVPVKVQGINAAGDLVGFFLRLLDMNEGRVASLNLTVRDPWRHTYVKNQVSWRFGVNVRAQVHVKQGIINGGCCRF